MNARDLMNEAASLPVEERSRLADLDSGKIRAVPGDEVFEKARRRFG